ncbi:MAG: hypothetical protein LBE04_05805 [Prevotellaceae bacterium]|jgi:hypothetical protein|nr:hypothetical protein [Prevotellaceae bacterium]
MNGKAIYEYNDISATLYNGVSAQTVKFIYETDRNNGIKIIVCLFFFTTFAAIK